MLQEGVIYRQVQSLVQSQISSRSESEVCTNVNSNHGVTHSNSNSRNDVIGGMKGGLQKFELLISTDISAKNLNTKYMSQYIHYIAICQ